MNVFSILKNNFIFLCWWCFYAIFFKTIQKVSNFIKSKMTLIFLKNKCFSQHKSFRGLDFGSEMFIFSVSFNVFVPYTSLAIDHILSCSTWQWIYNRGIGRTWTAGWEKGFLSSFFLAGQFGCGILPASMLHLIDHLNFF